MASDSSFTRHQENKRPHEENGNKVHDQNATSPIKHLLQREPLNIRVWKSSATAFQAHQLPPASTSSPTNQKRPSEIIDLTSDSESERPRHKKSRSSSDSSSDKSIEFPEHKNNTISTVTRKPTEKSPIGSDSSRSQHFTKTAPPPRQQQASSDLFQKKLHQQPSSGLFQRSIQQTPPSALFQRPYRLINDHQYASAVVVRSTPQSSRRPTPTPEESQQRERFLQSLRDVPNITLTNNVDNSSPPLGFRFVKDSVLREGVEKADEGFMSGCTCRKKRGSNECRYPNECQCLQDSAGEARNKIGQYHETGAKRGCLVNAFLQSRFHIFECNSKCDCSRGCKNRVVQHGRKIGLELYKTKDGRGWGMKTKDDVQQGQFIDTYRGEIITQAEADRRGEGRGVDKDNYLFDFDKFPDSQYVCDGEYIGGPTRFMNHSCNPNCAMFTVSFNHADTNIYELAFFAKEAIPAGTELTFDYQEDDCMDEASQESKDGGRRARITDEMAAAMEKEKGYAPSKCRCGSEYCRGYFFFFK